MGFVRVNFSFAEEPIIFVFYKNLSLTGKIIFDFKITIFKTEDIKCPFTSNSALKIINILFLGKTNHIQKLFNYLIKFIILFEIKFSHYRQMIRWMITIWNSLFSFLI